jgi:type IV secretory pathway protease TraF
MSAIEKFQDWGLTFRKPSEEQVELPPDITMLNSEQLGEIFTRLTAWTDYIASQLVHSQLEERAAQKVLEYNENLLLVKRLGAGVKGERVTTVKAEIAVNENIVSLSNQYEEKYAYRKLVEMLLNNHERDLSLVSREITRRSNDSRALRKEYGV